MGACLKRSTEEMGLDLVLYDVRTEKKRSPINLLLASGYCWQGEGKAATLI